MIPLVVTILGIVGPHIPDLIRIVENIFGPKTGATKLDAVLKALQAWIDALATGGKIPGAPPADLSYLIQAIEQALSKMKATGELSPISSVGPKCRITVEIQ